MEKEIVKLKLNATNIKNSLFTSNKELKKLRTQKKDLFFKLEKQKEVKAEEKRLETPQIGASFQRLASIVTTPAKSIFDRILEFFGLIAVRTLIGELPKLISQVEAFFNSDFIKTVGSIISTIGTGLQKVGELIGLIPKREQDEIMDELKKIEKDVDLDLPLADQADKDVLALEKQLGQAEKVNPKEKPEKPEKAQPIKEKPEKSEKEESAQPVQPIQSSQPTLTPPSQPEEKSKEPQKFSKGGTVKSEDEEGKPTYQPKKSIPLKRSERALTDGFKQFSAAVGNISESAERDEKNMLALAELSKNFNKWNALMRFFGGGDDEGDGGDGGEGEGDFTGSSDSEIAMNYLMSQGLTKAQAAGIAGNLQQESGFDPGADNGTHYGIAQWDKKHRWPRVKKHIESIGMDPESLEGQLAGLKWEATKRGDWRRITETTSAADSAKSWLENFERSGEKPGMHGYEQRMKFAESLSKREYTPGLDYKNLPKTEGNIISVGKGILAQGFTVGENKYFIHNAWSKQGPNTGGFDPRGRGTASGHANDADHRMRSLDVTDWRGSEASGVPRLKKLFTQLYNNRQKYGIKALIYDPIGYWFSGYKKYVPKPYGGHADHLHVGFTVSADVAMKEEKRKATLAASAPKTQEQKTAAAVAFFTQPKTQYVPVPYPMPAASRGPAALSSPAISPLWGG